MEQIQFKAAKNKIMTGLVLRWLKPFQNPLDDASIKRALRLEPRERQLSLQPLLAKTSIGVDLMPERSALINSNGKVFWIGKSQVISPDSKKTPQKELLETKKK